MGEATTGGALPCSAALETLADVVRRPATMESSRVADACREILRWAETRQLSYVALHFADAWARANPESAEAAATAGQHFTRAAKYAVAEEWLLRAAAVGRLGKEWEWYIRSHLRLGILRYELGDYRGARRYALRAAARASWSGHDTLAGMAYHDLLAVAIHAGAFVQGERYAGRALARYPVRFDRIRHLTHDFALFLTQRACFAIALPVLRALEPLFAPGDPKRLLWLATTAEAAAASRERPLFERVAGEALALVEQSDEHAAIAILRVAAGQRAFGLWNEAEALAVRGLEIATRRIEGEPQRLAYDLLDEIAERKPGPANRDLPSDSRARQLLASLSDRLAKQHRLGVLPAPFRVDGY